MVSNKIRKIGCPFFVVKLNVTESAFGKPCYLRFILSKLTKIKMLEPYQETMQLSYGQHNLNLNYSDTEVLLNSRVP